MSLPELSAVPRRLHILVCLALFALISWALLSSDPMAAFRNTPLSFVRKISDVVLHCGVYTVFAGACCSLIGANPDRRVRRTVITLLVVHGIGTEILQGWMPHRTSDPLDALANLSGITAGALLAAWAARPQVAEA